MYVIKDFHFVEDELFVFIRIPSWNQKEDISLGACWKYEKICVGRIESAFDAFNEHYLKKHERNVMYFNHKFEAIEKFFLINCDDKSQMFQLFVSKLLYNSNPLQILNDVINYVIEQKNISGVIILDLLVIKTLNILPKKLKYFIATKVSIEEVNLSHSDLLILALIGKWWNKTIFYHLPVNLILLDLSDTYIEMLKRVPASIKYLVLNGTISTDYSNIVTQNVKSLSIEESNIKYIRSSYMKQKLHSWRAGHSEAIRLNKCERSMYIHVAELEYLNINKNNKITIDLSECKKLKKVFFKDRYHEISDIAKSKNQTMHIHGF